MQARSGQHSAHVVMLMMAAGFRLGACQSACFSQAARLFTGTWRAAEAHSNSCGRLKGGRMGASRFTTKRGWGRCRKLSNDMQCAGELSHAACAACCFAIVHCKLSVTTLCLAQRPLAHFPGLCSLLYKLVPGRGLQQRCKRGGTSGDGGCEGAAKLAGVLYSESWLQHAMATGWSACPRNQPAPISRPAALPSSRPPTHP